MICDRCGRTAGKDEIHEHLGQTLCEDCYMDALSPVRTCDPWAAHSAKTFERHNSDPAMLNTVQKEILRILGETGGTDRGTLAAKMDGKATESEVEREFATLKHMDRVGAEKRDGVIFLRAL